jgi:hypothetical protein
MSTAFYPLGMNSMPASGFTHNSTTYNKQYIPWKGTGINSFPIGNAPGHIRPLTNKDQGNVFPTGFGLPRPIKHYRKGRTIVHHLMEQPHQSNDDMRIQYNTNRFVKTSTPISLGNSSSSSGLLNDLLNAPGNYSVKLNTINEENNIEQMNRSCKTCESIGVIASYKPNTTNLLENPNETTTNKKLCCNQEKFAKRRVLYASTNLKKNYYTTTKQYLQNRCKTFEQKSFNFLTERTNIADPYASNNPYMFVFTNKEQKPGGPTALENTYLANCQTTAQQYGKQQELLIHEMLNVLLKNNIITKQEWWSFLNSGINSVQGFFNWIQQEMSYEQKKVAMDVFHFYVNNPYLNDSSQGPANPTGCQLTVYKPNNYQYAKQGGVSSSTRLLKLNVDTISTNAALIQRKNTGQELVTANQIYAGDNNNVQNLLKNKAPGANDPLPLNFYQSGKFQNKKFCRYPDTPMYSLPLSKPGTYRYYPSTVFSSNHYSQTPNTYITNTN